MRRLCLLALVAGCGPSSFDDFRDQYSSRICANARRCGLIGRADPCPMPASLPSAGTLDVPGAIHDGKLRFDSDKAQDCLDEVATDPCSSAASALRFYEHCHAVLGPNVPVGGSCDDDAECVGGTCDAPAGCPGRCVAFPAPYSPCRPGECDPSVQYCGGGDPPTCLPHKSEGSRCSADDECDYPFFCVTGKCRHYPRTPDGKPCSDPAAVCNDGSYCTPDSLCAPLESKGARCDSPSSCRSGDGCAQTAGADAGVCRPLADDGKPCAPGLCPASQSCAPDRDAGDSDLGVVGLCRSDDTLPAGPHESCAARKCAGGLACSQLERCEWLLLRGGLCDPADPLCAPGLSCDVEEHRCKSSQLCAVADGGAPTD